MIKLYISSAVKIKTKTIVKKLLEQGVNSQVSSNYSSHLGKIEFGYKLTIFDVTEDNFKKDVWDVLLKLTDIKCGFIKYNQQYIGCTSEWAPVFTHNRCIGKRKRSMKMH